MAQRARISTRHGEILIELYADVAPGHVANFVDLAQRGFYNGKIFHRIIPNFMIQGGCPDGSGTRKHPDGKTLQAEFNDKPHVPGAVSAARTSDPNSAGCQFFICHGKHSPHLDGQYSLFGQVIEGMDAVNAIATAQTGGRDRPVEPVAMDTVTIEEA
jgi:cyclophilin family peptidyl-prolyl cis-trans isomerase